jgi:uncharacterized membrane protein/protein-disulfide isomerase
MKAHARTLIMVLAAVALAASIASLYVHYRTIQDPAYSSFCDVNETVSCQALYQSEYGSVFGVPVAAGGAIWASLMLILAAWGMRRTPVLAVPKDRREGVPPDRVAGYIFVLATIGLAAVFYFAYASFVVLKQACPLCITVYVSVVGIFIVSASAAEKLSAIPAWLGRDLGAITKSQTATTLAVAWLAAAVLLVVLFPREQPIADQPVAEADIPEPALETLTPEQQAEWGTWLDTQKPAAPELVPTGETKVLLIKFNDYQCPSCRQTWALYRGVIASLEKEFPGTFAYETRDLPLEPECGLQLNHAMACEAAAAVRMAKAKGKHREMETWLFTNQSFEMTRDQVKNALNDIAQVDDFDAQYPKMLEPIRADVQQAIRLGVTGTPTFYLNGIKISNLRPAFLDAAIRHLLKKAAVTS